MRRLAEASFAFLSLSLIALTVVATPPVQAQNFSVIYNFSGGLDGASPQSGLTVDNRGNFFGTTVRGGDGGGGTVFKIAHQGSGWAFLTLYSFDTRLSINGVDPQGGVVIGAGRQPLRCYGIGGVDGPGCETYGCGLVYKLKPSASALGGWTETVLYRFTGNPDGAHPEAGIIFDQAGNIYGTTLQGGSSGWGTAFELQRGGGGWTERFFIRLLTETTEDISPATWFSTMLASFTVLRIQAAPTAMARFSSCHRQGRRGRRRTLYAFPGQGGANPTGGLIFDRSGNLYGGTSNGGSGDGGTAFELTPQPNGNWMYSVLYNFTLSGTTTPDPLCSLTMDTAGNLYGTTFGDGAYGFGSSFQADSPV